MRNIALSEDGAVFHGFAAADIAGICEQAPGGPIPITKNYEDYPVAVAQALTRLRNAGVDGPYAIALGPQCYTGLTDATKGGYPIIQHVRRLVDGPIVYAPAVDGAVVLSMRGGDFLLTVGEDFSIGYLDHTAATVWRVLRWPLALALVTASIALLFRWSPRRHQPAWSWLAYGAAISVVLWSLLTLALGLFFQSSTTFSTTYGPLAGMMALLLWALLSSVAILFVDWKGGRR